MSTPGLLDRLRQAKQGMEDMVQTMPPGSFASNLDRRPTSPGGQNAIAKLETLITAGNPRPLAEDEAPVVLPTADELKVELERRQPRKERLGDEGRSSSSSDGRMPCMTWTPSSSTLSIPKRPERPRRERQEAARH